MSSEVDILIVGAGPTGLTLANDLLRRKVTFAIIDKEAAATTISKAIVVHARNLEMLENLKIVEPFLKEGLAIRANNIFADNKRIVHLNLDEIDSHFKFALTIPQNKTEQILADNLAKNGITVERNRELISFVDNGDSVSASIACTTGDGSIATENIKAKYLVGCDGAHSAVRHNLNLKFTGVSYDENFGAADIALQPGTLNLVEDEGYVFLSEDGILACFPFGHGRYRLIFDMPPLGEHEERRPLIFEEVLALVKRRGPQGSDAFTISDPRWMAWFKINRRCVTTYRKGRVFLAGDSAHIHSPVGGVGMNTGMQDAINLSWKLAMVVHDQAGENLLHSYNQERYAVGQAVLEGTDLATKTVTLRSPVAKNLRNNLMGFLASQEIVQQRILKAGSLTGINYRKSRLSNEAHPTLKESLETSLLLKPGHTQEDPDFSGENPGLSAWLDFARAPLAGDRVVDRQCQTRHGETRLAQIMASANFQLLLFDGYEPTKPGYEHFSEMQKKVQALYGDMIDVHVIVPFAQGAPQYDANYTVLNSFLSVLYDGAKELHQAYGASSECLYLIRPDGYIGFRCQPATFAELEKYLLDILKK